MSETQSQGTESLLQSLQDQLNRMEAQLGELYAQRLPDREAIIHQVNYTNHNLYLHLREAMRVRELYYRDTMMILDRLAHWIPKTNVTFQAERSVAYDTDDHKIPWGTAQDNTRSPRFVARCEELFNRPLTYMDLGCSGGGLALDFTLRGHRGFGVEGSDYSKKAQRAEWRLLRDSLFTADITRPFHLKNQDQSHVLCDVISAWEVMEHIADEDLPGLFENVRAHLKPDGIFVGSIALGPDDDPVTGARYHRTVQPYEWWEARYRELGFAFTSDHPFEFRDFCRGTSNGPIDPDYSVDPSAGFHFVARLV
ncbi:ubiquinone biosynthesis O-methyltransferase [Candidatus Phycosocius bacilliformis]|uniref:Ubiquinone biosynthesis O-methyltransferase n=1 Tax=Candidatus Phycosocius bacilliformis TaxID=1445552 RepID=A0A2P2E6G2_9PROT|nr:class I SAM-dependent methyltransferase [Candidatus Phycosocius bacilliformis]GBF56656.1 ubiquinone biosynthesis O-methyltransferase [Candidatus Phycosocius bacilliformis]